MKLSESYKYAARESLISVFFFGFFGLLYLATILVAYMSGVEGRGGWLTGITPFLILFGAAIYGLISYRNDKKDQRRLEKSEAEEEKYQLTIANKQ